MFAQAGVHFSLTTHLNEKKTMARCHIDKVTTNLYLFESNLVFEQIRKEAENQQATQAKPRLRQL